MRRSQRVSVRVQGIIVLTFVAVLILAVGVGSVQAAGFDRYEYPVQPGTDQWQAFQSHDEMLEALQIPTETLERMSTRTLADAVVRYPLLGDFRAYNDMQQGFEAVTRGFNGLQALMERPRAGKWLMLRYRRVDPSVIPTQWDLVRQGQKSFAIKNLEMLLAQQPILDSLSDAELDALLAETLMKGSLKLERFDVYGHPGIERTAFLAGRALREAESRVGDPGVAPRAESPALRLFLSEGTFAAPPVVDEVFARVGEHLGVAELSMLDERATLLAKDYYSTVYTPNGSPVTVIVMTWELSSSDIAAGNQWVATYYPNAVRETNSSRKYNCHSYAWYSQSTSNSRWMNSPGDDTYWQDGSYFAFYTISGARVSYVYGDHSAIAISSSEYRSKWGQLPRMRHAPTYCPYDSSVRYSYIR